MLYALCHLLRGSGDVCLRQGRTRVEKVVMNNNNEMCAEPSPRQFSSYMLLFCLNTAVSITPVKINMRKRSVGMFHYYYYYYYYYH